MRARTAALLLLCLIAVRMTAAPKVFDIRLEQLPDTGFEMHKRGAISIAYQMTVRNLSDAPLKLKGIRMRTVGRSPYQLLNEPAELTDSVEAGKEATVVFTLWRAESDSKQTRHATVWVEGTLSYETSSGAATQKFSTSFKEP